jgi:adenosylcobinamide kinase/adenosylcobinamide-phosphate guanylyltransferase
MSLVLLTGGARSGKSRLAVALGERHRGDVAFLATGRAQDEEMRARIARHRAERPRGWQTIEEPLRLGEAIAAADPSACLIIDCLTLWVANLLAAGRAPDAVELAGAQAAALAAGRPGTTVAVTNEVGLGIVPSTRLGREYRDLLGAVNAMWAARAGEAYLVVAGRVIALESAEEVVVGRVR